MDKKWKQLFRELKEYKSRYLPIVEGIYEYYKKNPDLKVVSPTPEEELFEFKSNLSKIVDYAIEFSRKEEAEEEYFVCSQISFIWDV